MSNVPAWFDGSPLLRVALAGLALILLLALVMWLASLARRDVSLVDRTWSVFITGAAIVYFALLPSPGTRGAWMLALAVAWALRLSLYVTARNWGHGEDRRYQAIRARNQPNFGFKSLYLVFALQAFLAWTVSAPFFVGMAGGRPLGLLDTAGLALAAFGILFEAIGDWQMSRFKADPANKDQVMDRGLWRSTRHPNYFGETCIWWGFWLAALGGAGWAGAWSVVSPLLMTVLLLKVSGVRLLEKDITERRPAYRAYIDRTNAFFPGPRRGGSA
jgi:steroid 5-alpha reductase family enzyme